MDGGGRLLGSLSEPSRPAVGARPGAPPIGRRARRHPVGRRSRPAALRAPALGSAAGDRRLPRSSARRAGLRPSSRAVGDHRAASLGGHDRRASRRNYGEPHDILARARRARRRARHHLGHRPARAKPRSSAPPAFDRGSRWLPRRDRGARPPRARAAGRERRGAQALSRTRSSITLDRARALALWQTQRRALRRRRRRHRHRHAARRAASPTCRSSSARTPTAAPKEYLALLDAAGPLRARIRAGMLVSGRRWTSSIDNGIDVRLPETDAGRRAGPRSSSSSASSRILDKDMLAIDLRMPDRVVVAPDRGGGRRPGGSARRRSRPAARGSRREPLRHGLTPRLKPLSAAQERDALGARRRHEQGRLPRSPSCMPAEPLETLRGRTHLAPHHRHRPPALPAASRAAPSSTSKPPRARSARRSMPPSAWPKVEVAVGHRQPRRAAGSARSITRRSVAVRGGSVAVLRRPSRARRRERRRPAPGPRGAARAADRLSRSTRQRDIVDPAGMIGERLGVDLHVVDREAAAARNLMLAVERCHLDVEAMVATPYAAGPLGARRRRGRDGRVRRRPRRRHDDRRRLLRRPPRPCRRASRSAATTSPWTSRAASRPASRDAERLKTLYGSAIATASDERDMISRAAGRRGRARRAEPRAEIASRAHHQAARRGDPRAGARPAAQRAGFAAQAGRRVVLTGGASQLDRPARGWRAASSQGQVRIGRPLGIQGLPEAAKGPAFSAAVGLLVYPQVAQHRAFRAARGRELRGDRDGRLHLAGRPLDQGEFLSSVTGGAAAAVSSSATAPARRSNGKTPREGQDHGDQSPSSRTSGNSSRASRCSASAAPAATPSTT